MASDANYRVLGIRKGATAEEIRAAYRRQARVLHPDVKETGSEAAFIELNRAYEQVIAADPEGSTTIPVRHRDTSSRPGVEETVVVLTASEARYGTRLHLTLAQAQRCPTCQGRAARPGAICLTCGGAEHRASPWEVVVDLPPSVQNGERITLVDRSQRPMARLQLRVLPT